MNTNADIPVISLAALRGDDPAAIEATARAFGAALENIGFATIVDHGVPPDEVSALYGQAKQFFTIPLERKLECTVPEKAKGHGYLPMGIESVAATLHGEEAPDLCEALVFIRPQSEGVDLRGRRNLWPSDMPELKDAVLTYFGHLSDLAQNLYKLSEIALDLPKGYLTPYFKEPAFTLRLANYPEQKVAPKPGQLRYGAHHDYGGLTILHQDDAPGGLQVRDRSGRWLDVPHRPGAFIINVGDLLSRWTNDRWRSTLHRVMNPPGDVTGATQRLSIVFFTGPDSRSEISVLPSCVSEDNPGKYEPVIAGEYTRAKVAASHNLQKAS